MKRFIVALLIVLFMQSVCLAQWAELMAVSKKKGGGGAGGTDFSADADCMGAWLMNSTSTPELDRSGEGGNLTWSSDPNPETDVPSGWSGKSLLFDTNDFLYHADGGSTDISGAAATITVYISIKFVDNSEKAMLGKWGASANYTIENNGTYVRAYVKDLDGVGSSNEYFDTASSNGVWTSYILTCDNSLIRTYINGVKDATTEAHSDGLGDGTAQFKIGNDAYGNDMSAYVNEAGVFSRALSDAECTELHATGIDGTKGGND